MLKTLKNEQGYLYALIEYEQIDDEHILIKYLWVHDNHRNNGCIPSLVKQMVYDKSTHKTEFVGWERGAKDQPLRWYPVYEILRRW